MERKAALRKLLRHCRGIQYVEYAEGHGDRLFEAVCGLGLEGIVSKKLDAPYRSGRPNLDQDQEPESAGSSHKSLRWYVLIVLAFKVSSLGYVLSLVA